MFILTLGYRLSSNVIGRLVFRFADELYQIDLDNFLLCMTKLLSLFSKYHKFTHIYSQIFLLVYGFQTFCDDIA